jgi:integrase
MKTVHRFLPLINLEPQMRLPCLLKMKRERNWRWNTLKTYHGSILAALKIMGLERTIYDKEASEFLEKQAVEEIPSVPTALSACNARSLLKMARKTKSSRMRNVMTAICFAFYFGQRISDVLLLRREDISIREGGADIVATVRRGKTVKHCKPFTLHVPPNHLGSLVRSWSHYKNSRLFPPNSKALILNILRSVNPDYELRSIRRGGLQLIATSGIDPEKLRSEFSKHRSQGMLYRYLEHGACLESVKKLHHWTAAFIDRASKLKH